MLETSIKLKQSNIDTTFPHQGNWTYKHWLKFPNDGWKYEIINGVLYMTPPPAVNHQVTSGGLFARMYMYAKDNNLGTVLEAPCGVRLSNQSVPVEPDIFFIKKERLNIITGQYIEGNPDLVVEILSPSNKSYDREIKFEVYQASGVLEYWLVDYESKTVEVFNLVNEEYVLSSKCGLGETVRSSELVGFEVELDVLFDF